MRAGGLWLALGGLFAAAAAVAAGPCPGTYELYGEGGQRTGTLVVSISTPNAGGISHLTSDTTLEVPTVGRPLHVEEHDEGDLGPAGLLWFTRTTNENGAVSRLRVERDGTSLQVKGERRGRKFGLSFTTGTYDLTEIEMERPGSPFHEMKPGQGLSRRVLYFDTVWVDPTTRTLSTVRQVTFRDDAVPAVIATTVRGSQPTTSWFDAETGHLLQDEGARFRMSRVAR